jgi:dTDP-4-dehydrorhamnose reductase
MASERVQTRVLVTGAAGMLGSQLLLSVPDGIVAIGTDLREAPGVEAVGVDLAEAGAVDRLLTEHGPFTGVIHAAAFTAVDAAEEQEELAQRVNETATRVLAEACSRADLPLVVVSTDFVFDGEAREPYTPESQVRPLSAYGRTKLAGEKAALEAHPAGTRIVRTQWLYGPRGKHFPGTMQQLARERSELRVVHDQVGSPTSTLELAPALWDVLRAGEPGIYHGSCEGSCSWYELAAATIEAAGIDGCDVSPCTTAEFPRPAHRPPYSVLDCSRLTALRGKPLADWRKALMTYLGTESS